MSAFPTRWGFAPHAVDAPEAGAVSFQESLRRLGDFVLAQVFRPNEAALVAAQVLIPAAEVPCRWRGTPPTSWVSVAEIVQWCGKEIHDGLIYEVYVCEILYWLQCSTTPWPTLWREAVTLHCYEVFGVDLTDDTQRAMLEEEAYEATREAEAMRYEERYVEETYVR